MTTTSRRRRATLALVVALVLLVALPAADPAGAGAPAAAITCPELIVHSRDEPVIADNEWAPPWRTGLRWADGGIELTGHGRWSPTGTHTFLGEHAVEAYPTDRPPWPPTIARWDGSEPVALAPPTIPGTSGGRQVVGAAWSPDGNRLAVTYRGWSGPPTRVVRVYGLDGTVLVDVTGHDPAWSPDGTLLAVATTEPAGTQVVDVTVAPPTVTTIGSATAGSPQWSSDGAWLAIVQADGALAVVRPDGTDLADVGTAAHAPAWRPGTHELAWAPSRPVAGATLVVEDADAATSWEAPLGGPATSSPVWAPDGGGLAVVVADELWHVPAGGAGAAAFGPMLPGAQPGARLAWSPDGTHLAYEAQLVADDTTVVVGAATPGTSVAPAPTEVARSVATSRPPATTGTDTPSPGGLAWSPDGVDLSVTVERLDTSIFVRYTAHGLLRDAADGPTWERLPGEGTWYPCPDGSVPATPATPTGPGWPAPRPPSSLTATVVGGSVQVRWSVPPEDEPLLDELIGWEVERLGAGQLAVLGADARRLDEPRPAPGELTYRVRALGPGEPSGWVSATIEAPPRPTVEGTVTSVGTPVEGATVTLLGLVGDTERTATTDGDGTWSVPDADLADGWSLRVEGPADDHVTQHVTGMRTTTTGSVVVDVALSPVAADPHTGSQAPLDLDGSAADLEVIDPDPPDDAAPAMAAATGTEVAVLDRRGRLLARVVDVGSRPTAVCALAGTLFVASGSTIEGIALDPDDPQPYGRRTPIVSPSSARSATCTGGAVWTVTFDPTPGTSSWAIVAHDPDGQQVHVTPFGDGALTAGRQDGEVLAWGPETGLLAPGADTWQPVAGGDVLDTAVAVTVEGGRAFSSDGWALDLATGEAERLVQLDGTPGVDVDVDLDAGIHVVGDAVRALDTGLVLESLPARTVASFSAAGDELLTLDQQAVLRVRPLPFTDVAAANPFRTSIGVARARQLVDGDTGNRFRPADAVSRQAAVALLWRAAGSPECACPDPGFADVAPDSPFATPIAWAAATGITTGRTDGTFGPTDPVTRGSWVAFQHRAAGSPAGPFPDPGFPDVPATHPFALPIAWAADAGLLTGYPDGTFRPGAVVTRQVAADLLTR